MNYLDFLQTLIDLGTAKLPLALEFVQKEEALILEYKDKGLFTLAISHGAEPEPDGECLDKEGEVLAVLSGGGHAAGAIGDGTLLRSLFAFISAHPELITLLLSLLKK
jgi:hypothetical protein